MNRVVFLDAWPLGLVTNPTRSASSSASARWLQSLLKDGSRVVVPEIAGYEVRRELLRANKQKGLAQLDALARLTEYLPLTTAAVRQAAVFWAEARQQGRPTAGDKTIDVDVILAAQVVTSGIPGAVIATTNIGHLSRFAPAELWTRIGGEPK